MLAGCTPTIPGGGNAGTEQLRAQLAPAMRDADISEACIQGLSFPALAQIKAAASPGLRISAGSGGLGNPR